MKKLLLLLFFILLAQNAHSQTETEKDKKILFSEALAMHLPKYNKKANRAYRLRDYEEGERLFDSLVKNCLRGSFFDNFKFKKPNEKEISVHKFKKPVYLITYASWCIRSKGEISALNRMAEKYRSEIDFIVLFWDKKSKVKEITKSYNEYITIAYVDELENRHAFVVKQLKHSFGLPTSFLIDADKRLLNIDRGISHSPHQSYEESFDSNYEHFEERIAHHILSSEEENSEEEEDSVWE